MAYPVQAITEEKVATGHLIFSINDNSVSTGAGIRVVIGRVTEVADIDTGQTLYEHKGYNADGTKQTVRLFPTEAGSGKFRVTLDEIHDIDGVTWDGEQVDVAIRQAFNKDTDLAWRMLAATAYIDIKSLKPNQDTPSTIVLEVTPYAAPGTDAWAFDAAFSVA
jgi:hypothetical protein